MQAIYPDIRSQDIYEDMLHNTGFLTAGGSMPCTRASGLPVQDGRRIQ
jgi:hypothetical protein